MIKQIGIIFRDLEQRKVAGHARLAKEDDTHITTLEQADAYRGPEFTLGDGLVELDIVLEENMAVVITRESHESDRIDYMYPLDTVARIKVVRD